jgi:uncharacterized protein
MNDNGEVPYRLLVSAEVPLGIPLLIGDILHDLRSALDSIMFAMVTAAMWNTYIWVDSADEMVAKARAAGGGVMTEAFDVADAGRMAVLTDPEGAAFRLWQPANHKGAQVVNEHGSLNFNTLLTRDPDTAEAFYGAVFGWQRLTIPAGVMWTLPGYGDHLEENTPGLREQTAQMGAPAGFIDVVGALDRIGAADVERAARWSVTFAVDDVAATAAKVRELGGQVVSGQFDAPWARLAVINDPQGARFIASQFVPENKDLTA